MSRPQVYRKGHLKELQDVKRAQSLSSRLGGRKTPLNNTIQSHPQVVKPAGHNGCAGTSELQGGHPDASGYGLCNVAPSKDAPECKAKTQISVMAVEPCKSSFPSTQKPEIQQLASTQARPRPRRKVKSSITLKKGIVCIQL